MTGYFDLWQAWRNPGPAATVPFAWIQCLRSVSAAWDLVAGGWQQHLTAHQGDVLFLPLSVCQWLLANRPTDWQQLTVVPSITDDQGLSNDAGTGLDYMAGVSSGVWGIDQLGPYFTPDGDMGSGESAYISVDSGNNVFLSQ